MMRLRFISGLAAWLLLGLIIPDRDSVAVDYRGLASIENYYTRDSSPSQDLDFLTMNLRFDAVKLDDSGRLSIHFAGRERLRLSTNDYNDKIHPERLDTLNVEYSGLADHWDFVVGRLKPKEFPLETVDGANIVFHTATTGIGLFGGLKPDPYTFVFTPDYPSEGAYLYYRTQNLSANLAFTHQEYQGQTDREYFYSYAQYYPFRSVSFYGAATIDIPPAGQNLRLTNAVGEITLRPVEWTSLTLGYNQFRAVQLFHSMDFLINTDRQQSYYARGDFRIYGQNVLFGRYERQVRDYFSVESPQRYADTYQGGLRNASLWGSGLNLSGSAARTRGFGYASTSYELNLSRLNWDVLDLSLNGSKIQTAYDLTDGTDRIWTYGASIYYYLSREWNIGVTYQEYRTADYKTESIFTRLTYRFKSSPPPEKKEEKDTTKKKGGGPS